MTAVDLWLIDTRQPAVAAAELWPLLDPDERARAARLESGPGERFTMVRGAVRQLVAARIGVGPAELVWRYGRYGKPEPAEAGALRVNWSASSTLAVLALAEGRAVGVDVERLHEPRTAGRMAARWFPAEEARFVAEPVEPAERATRFTMLWCRREACVKAYGGRLTQSFGVPVAGPSPVSVTDPGSLGAGPSRICDVPAPRPFRAAVAVLGDSEVHVNSRVWKLN
ncbi:4'-phosphopantetheinyl transferase family protein [Kitasatospora sp. NPDC091335]|uniref:4'-phosphopantetheinyl transferase family protein n=1 Tax=Kitasatospora sp. NPDC091335 TaxID=3364085 RepID=UPI0037FF246E